MIEQVILVDIEDRQLGVEEKLNAHREGKLHRAFSIFLFNSKSELLLQKRALNKYHSGGLWTNTCCGHPRPSEETKNAAARRLMEEMGIDCPIQKAFDFVYEESVGGGLVEYEFDHVFVGNYDGVAVPNRSEVMSCKWIDIPKLQQDIINSPANYTTWFKIALEGGIENWNHR